MRLEDCHTHRHSLAFQVFYFVFLDSLILTLLILRSGLGIKVNGEEILNAVTTGKDFNYWAQTGTNGNSFLLNHELGHTLGLADLYAFDTAQGQFPFTGTIT